MLASLWIVAVIVVWSLAFIRVPLWAWTLSVGLGLVLFTIATPGLSFIMGLIWLTYIIGATVFMVPVLRRTLITRYLFSFFRIKLPRISDTEQIALQAGDVWWEGDLFRGLPNWDKLHRISLSSLTEEETAFINHQAEHLCALLDAWKIDFIDKDLSNAAWDYLKSERFWGIIIPKEYGGLGFSALAHSTIVVKIASKNLSAAVSLMVPNSLGPAELLLKYGTDTQKNYYLPRLAVGHEIPCFALTGPEAGSDAGAIPDTGILCQGEHEGKTILGIRLSWDKRYITLAPIATVLGLAFKLYDPDGLLGSQKELGITLCLIPTHHPGVETGRRHLPVSTSFMNGPTRGKDVFIPLDWIIGGQEYIGQGWRMLMECLAAGRGISLPALSTANAKLCYRTTGAYAKVRQQFKVPIGSFEGVKSALGAIAGYTYMLEAMRLLTVSAIDQGFNPAITTAIAKYHMTEKARLIINHSMDIHGGRGIVEGPDNYLASHYKGIPIAITVEGANILTRNLIIFGQGAFRAHPYILQEIKATLVPEPKVAIAKFDKLIAAHIGYVISNGVRTITLGITGGFYRFTKGKQNKKIRKLYQELGRMSCALAFVSDIAMATLGSQLKRKENLSARLGDVLSQLYIASALLRYYEHHERTLIDLSYVRWGVELCLYEIQQAFDQFFINLPIKSLGRILRFWVFPLGRRYRLPKDDLLFQNAELMMQTSTFRDRLTAFCYQGHDNDIIYRLEQALLKTLSAEPAIYKLAKAVKQDKIMPESDYFQQIEMALNAEIISSDEAELLREYETLRRDIIQVNDFNFNYFKREHLCQNNDQTQVA